MPAMMAATPTSARRWFLARVFPAAVVIAFAVLSTLNSGGYRYGVSDQAFYIPAVLMDLDPSLFPRDRVVIAPQAELLAFDEIVAAAVRTLGVSIATAFLLLQIAMLAVFGSALWLLGREFLATPWATAAFVLGMTMRHRIAKTGVNTHESYFHPRMFAFAIGVAALVSYCRERRLLAVALVAMAFLFHPTTALWFVVCLAGIWITGYRARWRTIVAGFVVVLGATAALLSMEPFRHRLTTMDPAWVSAIASRDYLFPSGWSADAWLINFGYVALVLWIYRTRRQAGVAHPHELGIVVGLMLLVGVFVTMLPLLSVPIALAVQLQTPRVFWLLDLFATLFVAWWIAERPRARPRAAIALFVVIAIASTTRGGYVTAIEHAGRAVVQRDLPDDAWTDVGTWAQRSTPAGAAFLVDPSHGWRLGSSFRITAHRDMLAEDQKDVAMGMYSRDVAARVSERLAAVGDFAALTPDRARALAARYGLSYVITERPLDLPLVYDNHTFRVYALQR